jgi:hypothetical protein
MEELALHTLRYMGLSHAHPPFPPRGAASNCCAWLPRDAQQCLAIISTESELSNKNVIIFINTGGIKMKASSMYEDRVRQ